MAQAVLNIEVIDRRLIKKSEAARYCGLACSSFEDNCPVQPIEIRPGMRLWDKRDLDKWIDALKGGGEMMTQEAIISRLE